MNGRGRPPTRDRDLDEWLLIMWKDLEMVMNSHDSHEKSNNDPQCKNPYSHGMSERFWPLSHFFHMTTVA